MIINELHKRDECLRSPFRMSMTARPSPEGGWVGRLDPLSPPPSLYPQACISLLDLSWRMEFSVDTLAVISISLAVDLRNSPASWAPVLWATPISSRLAVFPAAIDIKLVHWGEI